MVQGLKIGVVSVLTVATGALGGVAFASAASAADQGILPAIKAYGSEFYTQAQIDDVWRDVTGNWSAPLPGGKEFPAGAPAFFHPTEPNNDLYEVGLPVEIAGRYWRCMWLDEAVHGSNAIDRSRAANWLADFAKIPELEGRIDNAYDAKMAALAKRGGVTPFEAELDVECAGITE
ncbi:hypothetical protein GCM10009857_14740 [Agromyces soli]